MYVKLFSAILDSSLWVQPPSVRVVWITLMAMSDREGYVWASPSGLARRACVSPEDCAVAVAVLSGPDPEDSSGQEDGRRIIAFQGGWRIVNYVRYRDMADADIRREQVREAVQRHRAKAKAGVIIGKQSQALVVPSESESESDADPQKTPLPPKGGDGPLPPKKPIHPEDDPPIQGTALDTPAFRAAWAEWLAYRRQARHRRYTPIGLKKLMNQLLKEHGHDGAIAAINRSIAAGWQGIFPGGAGGADRAAAGAIATRHHSGRPLVDRTIRFPRPGPDGRGEDRTAPVQPA